MEKVTKGLTNWLSSEGMTQKDKANNNKSDFDILFDYFRLFVYNHNFATERINHRQHLFHSRSATILKVDDGG